MRVRRLTKGNRLGRTSIQRETTATQTKSNLVLLVLGDVDNPVAVLNED